MSPVGPARTQRLLDAALTSQAAGCVGAAVPLLELALAETDEQHSITMVQHLQCRIQMWCGQPIEARDDLLALADRTEIAEPAWSALMRSQAALLSATLGEQRLALETARRAADLVRHLPAVTRLPVVLIEALTLAIDGDSATARDLLAWCEKPLAQYDPLSIDQLLVVAANAYASVEDQASVRRWLECAVRLARSSGAVGLLPFQLSWLATACWRYGDWAAGLAHAHAAVSLTEETGWLTELPHALIVLPREAGRTGRPTECAVAARCRGLLSADEEQGHGAFVEALQWHERARQPFEQARSQLCFGEFLRRHRRPTDARQVFADALGTFTRLGARLWAQRTDAELRATGIASRPRREGSTTQLTPQELQVALVVADGATNVEAAAQLFLSAKTIEFHLSNTYRKLGIRSRGQLARSVFGSTRGPFGGTETRDGVPLPAR